MKLFAHNNGSHHEFDVSDELGHLIVHVKKEAYVLNFDSQPGVIRTMFVSGGKGKPTRKIEFGWIRTNNQYQILIDGIVYDVEVRDARSEHAASLAAAKEKKTGAIEIRAPIPGQITKILAPEGTEVHEHQPVLTLDAMKLENEIQAPKAGRVRSLAVKAGSTVDKGQLLFIIK